MTTINFDRAELASALVLACRIISRRNTIPVLACVRIDASPEGVALVATDIDAVLRIDLPGATADGAASVITDAHPLRDLVKGGTATTLQMQPGAIAVSVSMGALAVDLPTMKAADWPDDCTRKLESHAETAAFELPRGAWANALDSVGFAISTEETRYYLNGIYLHTQCGNVRMVATDGHRLACHDLPVPAEAGADWSTIVPRFAVNVMEHAFPAPKTRGKNAKDLPPVTVRVLGHKAIAVASGAITITTKSVEGTFPDYGRCMPTAGNPARFDRDAMVQAATSLKAIWGDASRSSSIVLHFEPGQIVLSAARDNQMAEIAIPCEHECESLQIAFNAKYVLELLKAIPSGTVTGYFTDPGAPTLFKREDGTQFVLMPMRANTDRKRAAAKSAEDTAPVCEAPTVAHEPAPLECAPEAAEAQEAPAPVIAPCAVETGATRHAIEREAPAPLVPATAPDAEPLERYLASLAPLARGKARAALERVQGFSGIYMPRHQWAERNAATVWIDHDKARVMLGASFYAFADVTGALVAYLAWMQRQGDASDVPDLPADPCPAHAGEGAPEPAAMVTAPAHTPLGSVAIWRKPPAPPFARAVAPSLRSMRRVPSTPLGPVSSPAGFARGAALASVGTGAVHHLPALRIWRGDPPGIATRGKRVAGAEKTARRADAGGWYGAGWQDGAADAGGLWFAALAPGDTPRAVPRRPYPPPDPVPGDAPAIFLPPVEPVTMGGAFNLSLSWISLRPGTGRPAPPLGPVPPGRACFQQPPGVWRHP